LFDQQSAREIIYRTPISPEFAQQNQTLNGCSPELHTAMEREKDKEHAL